MLNISAQLHTLSNGITLEMLDDGRHFLGIGKVAAGDTLLRNGRRPMFVEIRTPNLQREFLLYKKRVTKDDVKEEVVDKDNHLLDAMGYLAAFDPTYIEPPEGYAAMQSLAVQAWKKLAGHGRPESEHVWLGAGAVPDAPFSAAL
jgi:hypothetical protein